MDVGNGVVEFIRTIAKMNIEPLFPHEELNGNSFIATIFQI